MIRVIESSDFNYSFLWIGGKLTEGAKSREWAFQIMMQRKRDYGNTP
jgi:hypothetical protein